MSSDIESIIHPHKKEGSRSEEHLIYFKWLQSIPNTFALALRMNNDCALKSELVSELAQHLDPSELLLEILALLNDASPRANLHSEKTINNIKTALLALMKTKFSSLDSESQHVLIHQIAEKNKTHTSFDVLCFLQQLVPLLNEPGLPEHDVMLRACCAIEAKHSQHPRKKENGYTQAWKYFVALPFEVRCEYRKQYSRLFNYLEQKNMPSAAEENSSRVFKPSVTSVRNELEKEPDDALEIVLRGSSPS